MIEKIWKLLRNCKDGWRTTLAGVVIIGAAILSVFYTDIGWTEASVGILIGLALFLNSK